MNYTLYNMKKIKKVKVQWINRINYLVTFYIVDIIIIIFNHVKYEKIPY